MAHKHSVYDTDLHFVIDPITRKITTECKKTQLMQKDHNSERFTFEIPRYIEGHDMSLCNVVQIHYINTNSTNKDYQVQDIYEVNDLQVSPDSEDIVIGSWLISSNATTYSGTLNFVIRFACVDEETKAIDYQWFTDIYSAITVAKTIYNVDVVTEGESSDLLEKWKEEISKAADESTLEIVQEAKKSEQAASNSASAAAQSETKAKASATDAASSARSASDSAGAALESANSAQQSADTANTKATEASESAESASSSAQSSSISATSAGDSATAASGSATLAESYAHGGTGTRESEDTDNAKYWAQEAKKSEQSASNSASAATQSETKAKASATDAASSAQSASDDARTAIESSNSAQQSAGTANTKATEASESAQSASSSASSAVDSATAASASAILAESYTHGRTGTREGEDTDNAKYYMEQTKAVSIVDVATTEKAGIVKPDGTTITADADGTIHGANTYELPVATTDTLGGVKPDDNTITADADGVIRVNADSALSATSTNPVQNKVVKSYVDGTFRQKLIAMVPGDDETTYCRLCTIKINGTWLNYPIEITVQERARDTLDRLTVLFNNTDNIDPDLTSFNVFGGFNGWYISKIAASTWAIYVQKSETSASIRVLDYIGIDAVDVTWDGTGVASLPDSRTAAVWGGTIGHADSADSANSAHGVADYNNANVNIKIGYYGDGLKVDQIRHIAGFTGDGNSDIRIKDVPKYELKSWLGDATTSDHGLMTPAMVSKLNSIAEGANRTTVDDAMSDISTNPVQNNVIKSYVDNGLNTLKKSVSDGKTLVATAITEKGVNTAADATFAVMAKNIGQIETGGGELHGATISVTTSEENPTTITVTLTKDSTTIEQKNFDSNGMCTFTDIQESGDYTVAVSDGTNSNSTTATVTGDNIVNKTVISVTIDFTLDGSTATPLNDVSIWLRTDSTGSSANAGHTTLAQVIADPDTLNNLMRDQSAMQYLARSTGFADEGCASETFMTYLGSSSHVDSTVLNSDLWVEAIGNSSYMENILSPLIPTMTSNTTPSGIVSCSSVWNNNMMYGAYRAFDGIVNTENFWEADGRTAQWLKYEFPNNVKSYILEIDLSSTYHGDARYTDPYYLQVSSDGTNWENILTVTPTYDEIFQLTRYKIETPTLSKHYRWYFPLGCVQGTYRYTHVTQAQLYGR